MIRVVLAGVTGWVGRALLPAIVAADDLKLVGAAAIGVTTVATLAEALNVPSDVLVDYTLPRASRRDVV